MQGYWNDWYLSWGWFLWLGVWVLLISNVGHWGYSYRSNRRNYTPPHKTAVDLVSERYARGEISRDEFSRIKGDIVSG